MLNKFYDEQFYNLSFENINSTSKKYMYENYFTLLGINSHHIKAWVYLADFCKGG